MASSPTIRKPLGVRATAEEHAIITEAAQREHRSVNSFVLRAALHAAETQKPAKPKKSIEEVRAILDGVRDLVKAANPTNRDILAEFLAERREAAARGE